MEDYFTMLGYINNVPSQVLVAVIESALERGCNYEAEDYHGRYNLTAVTLDASGVLTSIGVSDNTTYTEESIVYDAQKHIINGRKYFTPSMADYICGQMLKLFREREYLFNKTRSISEGSIFPFDVTSKILRTMIISMDDKVVFRKRGLPRKYPVEEKGDSIIILCQSNGTEVVYTRYTDNIEILDGEIGPRDANMICICLKDFR